MTQLGWVVQLISTETFTRTILNSCLLPDLQLTTLKSVPSLVSAVIILVIFLKVKQKISIHAYFQMLSPKHMTE